MNLPNSMQMRCSAAVALLLVGIILIAGIVTNLHAVAPVLP